MADGRRAAASRGRRTLAACLALALPAVGAPSATQERTDDRELAQLLGKAGEYVLEYGRVFQHLVAEETYTQKVTSYRGLRTQVTRSDIVFVATPGPFPWSSFRDVYEVNGTKVRDREARLEKLFLTGDRSGLAKAVAIRAESARYNIGSALRTVNEPTLSLMFLHPQNQGRFEFRRKGRRRFFGVEGVEVAFTETARPTLVRAERSEDLAAKGRFWVDPGRGTILRAEVAFHFRNYSGLVALARIAVDYRPSSALSIWLPAEMNESYQDLLAAGNQPVFREPTEAAARYSKFRKFTVTTEEEARLPE